MAVELEGLSYEIEAQTGDSAKQLDTLASSLEKLKAASGGLKLGNVSNQLKKLSEAVSGIDNNGIAKLRRLSEGLGKLAAAGDIKISKSIGSGIASISKGMDTITDEKIDRITRLAEALKKLGDVGPVKIPNMKNLDAAADAAKSTIKYAPSTDVKGPQDDAKNFSPYIVDPGTAMKQYIDATTELSAAGRVAVGVYNGLNNAIAGAGNSLRMFGGWVGQVAEHVPSLVRDLTVGFAKLPLMFGGRVLNGVRGMVSSLGDVFSGLMRIAKFRAYRTVIKLFTQGLKEGLDNLYYYSQLAGTSFAGALDSIATSANYVKNSLGAMASPLIEAVAPAIDYIADKVVALFNLINQLFSRLTGKSTYTAAKKISTTYKGAADSAGKSASGAAKKAKDELKKTILAFDEINKLNEPNKSSGGSGGGGGGAGGGGGGYGDMFEERPIDQAISDFADQLKAAINAGDWDGVGRLFGDKVNQIFDLGGGEAAKKKWEGWGHTVAGYVNNAIDFAYGFLDETKFNNIGKRIAQFMNGLFDRGDGIDFYKLGYTLQLAITDALDFVIGFIEEFDTEDFGSAINRFMRGFYDKFATWVNDSDKDWEKLGETLEQKIVDFVFGLDAGSIEKSFRRAMSGAVTAITNIIKGMFVGLGTDLKSAVDDKGLLEVGTTILNKIRDGVMDSNPIQWIITYIIDPMIGALIGPEKWAKAKETASTLMQKIGEGFMTLVNDPAEFGKKYIIEPIVRALQDKLNWSFKLPDLFGGGKGFGDLLGSKKEKGVEVPITAKVQDTSSDWLSTLKKFWFGDFGNGKNAQGFSTKPDVNRRVMLASIIDAWAGLFGKGKNVQEFSAEVKNTASTWLKNIKNWWKGLFGDKNKQEFTAEVKNSSSTWLSDVKKWWSNIFGGKNVQQFEAKGNLTKNTSNWDSAVQDVINRIGKTFHTTVNTNLGKGTWNTDANGVLGRIGKTFQTTVNTILGKGSWNNSAENVLNKPGSATKTVTAEVKKGSWSDSGYNAANMDSSTVTRTVKVKVNISDSDKKILQGTSRSGNYTKATGGVFSGGKWAPVQRYAAGGSPFGGQMFIAREAGPELVGTLGSHTAVMNNDQIVASVSAGVARAIAGIHFQLKGMQMPQPAPINEYLSAPEASHNDNNGELVSEARQQNALLRRQNDLLQRLLDKDTTVEVTTKQFASAANRQNRREGRTTIAVSAT